MWDRASFVGRFLTTSLISSVDTELFRLSASYLAGFKEFDHYIIVRFIGMMLFIIFSNYPFNISRIRSEAISLIPCFLVDFQRGHWLQDD